MIVLNVNDVEHVASTVDFVFSAVDMSKEEIKVNRRGICKNRDSGRIKQQRASLDAGRSDGSTGDQCRTF